MPESTLSGPGPLPPSDLLAALHWRYATKTFDPGRKIASEIWDALEAALVLSPSSFGMQPWKFIVVTDPAIRAKLKPAAWDQAQVVDASHLVVIARRTVVEQKDVDRLIHATAAARKIPSAALDTYKGMITGFIETPGRDLAGWATKQAYIALGFLLESAALLGVDACPMEGIDPARFDEMLGIPTEGYTTTVACALGYRSTADKYATAPKVRFPAAEMIRHV